MNQILIKNDVRIVQICDNGGVLRKLESIKQKLAEQNLRWKVMLSTREASLYLSISQRKLRELASAGKIPHFCPEGNGLYFNRYDLDDWMQGNPRFQQQEDGGDLSINPKNTGGSNHE